MASEIRLEVAVPCPLRNSFTYCASDQSGIRPGDWVEVPFGRRRVTGLVLALSDTDSPSAYEIKAIHGKSGLPQVNQELLDLINWSVRYYHAPPWDVVNSVVPTRLLSVQSREEKHWQLHPDADLEQLSRAPRQRELADWLRKNPGAADADIQTAGFSADLRRQLEQRGIVQTADAPRPQPFSVQEPSHPIALDPDQAAAVAAIGLQGFQTYLLEGPTGSGKTEVYLEVAQKVIDAGRQVLLLVPEIGLTPQTENRFRNAIHGRIATYHSGMKDAERRKVWQACRSGDLDLVIGTRSAVFLPFARTGLLVLDEEHDNSYKQQEGWRYHARNIAAVRASNLGIPLLLGSATPSLDSLLNVQRGRYQLLELRQRHGNRPMPVWQILPPASLSDAAPLSTEILDAINSALERGNQVLVFLNRRGFAPSFECQSCRWVANCDHCSVRLTAHLKHNSLICHQCGSSRAIPRQCDQCQSHRLEMLGLGTERLENFFRNQYPDLPLLRIDRDNIRHKGKLKKLLDQAAAGEPAILIGTQMLAKGHHFPGVTLAVILGLDQGLMSADPCALEQTAQLCIQVAGRAGRGDRPGTAILETSLPDHPALDLLTRSGYRALAESQLQLRRQTGQPPQSFWSMLRAEHKDFQKCEQALERVTAALRAADLAQVQVLGPLPCLLERRGNRYRYQLQIYSPTRSTLHQATDLAIQAMTEAAGKSRLRWSVDIDPVGMD